MRYIAPMVRLFVNGEPWDHDMGVVSGEKLEAVRFFLLKDGKIDIKEPEYEAD